MGYHFNFNFTLGLLLLLVFNEVGAQSRVDSIRAMLLNPNLQEVLVVAHRGDWRNSPENSLAAIDNAIKMGVDIVEVDVQRTKDGQLILMHDTSIDRTTTGKGKIKEITLDSIRKVKLKNGCAIRTIHDVPTLEEVLNHAKGKVMLNLDKADRYFDEVYALLEKTGTTKQIIMKGTKSPSDVRKKYGDYLKNVIYMPIVKLDKGDAIDYIRGFQNLFNPPIYVFLFSSRKNENLPKAKNILENNALIWCSTLWDTMSGNSHDDLAIQNPEATYGYLINSLGVRVIQTDRPAYLLKYLREKKLHK
ncbi:glycerophosphodiester phosphodiesterase family protein [Ornithobacterium rhinotracheale]|uniref:glycerophosphodiester phosphodiesterase family protein n=1 Tax=Ornithobacterium rhinotracheale TaxID=28251 RepID=UPI0040364ED7